MVSGELAFLSKADNRERICMSPVSQAPHEWGPHDQRGGASWAHVWRGFRPGEPAYGDFHRDTASNRLGWGLPGGTRIAGMYAVTGGH